MPIPPGQSDDPVAQFPTSIFDGTSESRPTGKEFSAPEANDWQQIVNEMIAVQKAVRPAYDDLIIWVSPTGVAANATGSITNPYATLATAFAAISATKKIVILLPGTYTLTAAQALPIAQDNVKIIGIGDVTVVGADADQAFSLTPGAQGAAFTITLENINITQFAAKKGLYIDDTGIDGAVTVNINNCTFTMDTSGSSIDLLHAVDQTVAVVVNDSTFTGAVTVDCINSSDAFTFTRCNLAGGLVSDTGAVAAAFKFQFCEILASGVTGGHSSQTIVALYCTASDDTLAETGEFAGSHTETLVSPTSA
jgi:hypothetical protein